MSARTSPHSSCPTGGTPRSRTAPENLKDTGLARLPFHDYQANQLWLELAVVATLLLGALALLVEDDQLAVAEPRRLRYALLAVAAPGRCPAAALPRASSTLPGYAGSSSMPPGPGRTTPWAATRH